LNDDGIIKMPKSFTVDTTGGPMIVTKNTVPQIWFKDTSVGINTGGLWRFDLSSNNLFIGMNQAVAGDFSSGFIGLNIDNSGNVSIQQGQLIAQGLGGFRNTSDTVMDEGTPSGASATKDVCQGSSTAHALQCSYNNGSFFSMTQTIGSGTVTTPGTAVTNGTCQVQTAITVTGATTTDVAHCSLNAAAPATWQTGIFLAIPEVTSNTVTVRLCNGTAASITPAAATVRCTVTR